jgi:hypothetical protein
MTMNLPSTNFHMFTIIIVIGNPIIVWIFFKNPIKVLVHIIEKVEFH